MKEWVLKIYLLFKLLKDLGFFFFNEKKKLKKKKKKNHQQQTLCGNLNNYQIKPYFLPLKFWDQY